MRRCSDTLRTWAPSGEVELVLSRLVVTALAILWGSALSGEVVPVLSVPLKEPWV